MHVPFEPLETLEQFYDNGTVEKHVNNASISAIFEAYRAPLIGGAQVP